LPAHDGTPSAATTVSVAGYKKHQIDLYEKFSIYDGRLTIGKSQIADRKSQIAKRSLDFAFLIHFTIPWLVVQQDPTITPI